MREHVIINQDRTVIVPESEKKIGIQYDHNVNTISFDCPRYPDEDPTIDMSTMSIYINYMLADKTLGSSLAINVAIDEMDPNIIHFDWKITHAITSIKGLLSTLICIKQVDDDGNEIYHWNTNLIQKFFVGEGMECLEPIVDMNPDVITQLLQKINTNETEIDTLKNHTYKVIYENRLKSENETFVVGRNVEVNDVLRIYNPETLDPFRKGADITNADGTVLDIMIGRGATSEILVESDMQSIEVYTNFWLEIIRSPIITNTLRLNSLEQDIHTIELKLPFGLGIDENGNCGYVKPGEHTVTPFGSGGSGGSNATVDVLWDEIIESTGTYTLAKSIDDYDFLIASAWGCAEGNSYEQSNYIVIPKKDYYIRSTYNENIGWAFCINTTMSGYTRRSIFQFDDDTTLNIAHQTNSKFRALYGVKIGSQGGSGNVNIYSTEEQVIGTWIDGKQIYSIVTNEPIDFYKYGNTTELVNDASNFEGHCSSCSVINDGEIKLISNDIGNNYIKILIPIDTSKKISFNRTEIRGGALNKYEYWIGSSVGTSDIDIISVDKTTYNEANYTDEINLAKYKDYEQVYITINLNVLPYDTVTYQYNSILVHERVIKEPYLFVLKNNVKYGVKETGYKYYSEYTKTTDHVYNRIPGAIEQLQMAKVTGLTSEMTVETVTE